MAKSTTTSGDTFTIQIDEGCMNCPFVQESHCGAAEDVVPTHDFSYPAKCPLLRFRTIIVERRP